jgi:hypothetical protein
MIGRASFHFSLSLYKRASSQRLGEAYIEGSGLGVGASTLNISFKHPPHGYLDPEHPLKPLKPIYEIKVNSPQQNLQGITTVSACN